MEPGFLASAIAPLAQFITPALLAVVAMLMWRIGRYTKQVEMAVIHQGEKHTELRILVEKGQERSESGHKDLAKRMDNGLSRVHERIDTVESNLRGDISTVQKQLVEHLMRE